MFQSRKTFSFHPAETIAPPNTSIVSPFNFRWHPFICAVFFHTLPSAASSTDTAKKISTLAIDSLSSLLNDISVRLIRQIDELMSLTIKKVVQPRTIAAAVRLEIPSPLSQQVLSLAEDLDQSSLKLPFDIVGSAMNSLSRFRVSIDAMVHLTAVLEALLLYILRASELFQHQEQDKRLLPYHIYLAIRDDPHLRYLLRGVQLVEGISNRCCPLRLQKLGELLVLEDLDEAEKGTLRLMLQSQSSPSAFEKSSVVVETLFTFSSSSSLA